MTQLATTHSSMTCLATTRSAMTHLVTQSVTDGSATMHLAAVDAPESASDPPSEAVLAELKEQVIKKINHNLAEFPASLRDVLIERVRSADVGVLFYWCKGLCDYKEKLLVSSNTLEGNNREEYPSTQFYDC